MIDARDKLSSARRWVVKIGSALATNEGRGLRIESIDLWVGQAAMLRKKGADVVLVTSGSVAEGVHRLGWKQRPRELHKLQAAAAMGQMGLVQAYQSCFDRYGLHTAQILLTHADFSDRQRYLNARSVFRTLLAIGAVPVVNENDTVATEEIKLGDNDTLAALVANLLEADVLVILTDQEGLYDKDPRCHSDAVLIHEAKANDPHLDAMAGDSGVLGRGGMRTKLRAAALAAHSGTATIIASGHTPAVLEALARGESVGTLLVPQLGGVAARKRWLAGGIKPRGKLALDSGAVEVLRGAGRSLLAVGVTAVEGEFARGELVACVGPDGREVARGLVNYSATETRVIRGQPSDRIEALLGYVDEPELIHRDNLVFTG